MMWHEPQKVGLLVTSTALKVRTSPMPKRSAPRNPSERSGAEVSQAIQAANGDGFFPGVGAGGVGGSAGGSVVTARVPPRGAARA